MSFYFQFQTLRFPVFFIALTATFALGIGTRAIAQTAQPAAAINRSQKPEPEAPPAISFPSYLDTTLRCGLKVFIIVSERQPSTAFRLLIKGGDLYDGAKPGLAGMTARLLRNGTSRYTAAAFDRKVDLLGASFETGSEKDALHIALSGQSEDAAELLDLMTDAVLRPTFPAEELEKEKARVVARLEVDRSRPLVLADRMVRRVLFGAAHPYGAALTAASINALTAEDLKAHHRTYFVPNHASLAVVTSLSAADILPQLEKAFADWKPATVESLPLPSFPKLTGVSVHLINRSGAVQSTVMLANPMPPRREPEMIEFGVVSTALGGDAGRLPYLIRERGYAYGASSFGALYNSGGLFISTAEVRSAATVASVNLLYGEHQRIAQEPMREREFSVQRDYMIGGYLRSLEGSARLAVRVQDIDLYGFPKDYYQKYVGTLSALTLERATELAKKYIDVQNVAVIVVGDAATLKPQLESLVINTPGASLKVYDQDLNPLTP